MSKILGIQVRENSCVVLCSKLTEGCPIITYFGGCKVNLDFHLSEVNQMSTRNSNSGSAAMKELNSVHKKGP